MYDGLILKRLQNWFNLSREKAGAQPRRGCIEQIVSLRLIFDCAMKKKQELFVCFIDYSAAYDKVPRDKLIRTLEDFNCPHFLLSAIKALYKKSFLILEDKSFETNCGVRQGAPSSGFLFCVYIERFIVMLRRLCPNNGFLQWIHCLCLMDDQVIISTNPTDFQNKLDIMANFSSDYGMVINFTKTNFLILNASSDMNNFYIGANSIERVNKYCYLGTFFSDDGNGRTSLKLQAAMKEKEINKFISFLIRNKDFPFWVKVRVFEACIVSSILYGCESWLIPDLSSMNNIYMRAVKALLGVRHSTPNDLCLIELGFPTLIEIVRKKQFLFHTNHTVTRSNIT